LMGGVNAGVSAARTNYRYRCIGDLTENIFEGFLDGGQPQLSLRLPSVEGTAVVFERQCHPVTSGTPRREGFHLNLHKSGNAPQQFRSFLFLHIAALV